MFYDFKIINPNFTDVYKPNIIATYKSITLKQENSFKVKNSIRTVIVCILPDGSVVKNLPANARDRVSIPKLGRSPGEGNGSSLRILAWRIPWTEEPGRLHSMGLHKS